MAWPTLAWPCNGHCRPCSREREHATHLAIQDVIQISNTDPELVFGPFDFSKTRILRRIEAGYRDADKAVAGTDS